MRHRPRDCAVRFLLALTVIPALAVGGCAQVRELIGTPATPTAEPTVHIITPSTSPTVPSSIKTAADVVGTWSDPKAQWTVHFAANGNYVEDFEGVSGFRNGTYKVHNDRVFLVGADGEADTGQITGETIVFQLGTLTRVGG